MLDLTALCIQQLKAAMRGCLWWSWQHTEHSHHSLKKELNREKSPQHLKELLLQIKQTSQLLQHETPHCRTADLKPPKPLHKTRNTEPWPIQTFSGAAVSLAKLKPLRDNIYHLRWSILANLHQICLYFPPGRWCSFAQFWEESVHLFTRAEMKSELLCLTRTFSTLLTAGNRKSPSFKYFLLKQSRVT